MKINSSNHKSHRQVSVGMLSLGCPKTLVDSEIALGILQKSQFEIATSAADCDVAIVNTCAFIHNARQESIEKILALSQLKEKGRIQKLVVMGCLAQKYYHELESQLPLVDAFVGSGDYPKIAEIIDEVRHGKKIIEVGKPLFLYDENSPRFSLTPSHYRYVKISEGCNHKCSFCIIPQLKGLHRSRPIEDVAGEVTRHGGAGAREIILTGQDTTYYGRDFAGKFMLADLLKALDSIENINWVRLLYAYPAHLSDDILDAIRESKKVVKYIDVPLQHISDSILQSMKRAVTGASIRRLVQNIRKRVPGAAIRTTFIVGYPGETEQDFEELLDFIQEAKFDRLGVFPYSYEQDSYSGTLPHQVPEKLREERYHRAMALQQKVSLENNRRWIGKELQILIEGTAKKNRNKNIQADYVGRSYRDAPDVDGLVYVRANPEIKYQPGDIIPCRIREAFDYDLSGEALCDSNHP
ncbi:MAG: 30S ribosomal protein S12 methylthiotransferase RimO [Candidatus Omnitrophica bacterium]|nr:30S ribosomal protein S12 methylthiotransferase RimO [Candidatus Omnitrophota bacterium]